MRHGEPQELIWTVWRSVIFLHRDERIITTSALITVTESHYRSTDVREVITLRDSHHLPWKLLCWPLFLFFFLVGILFIYIYCILPSEMCYYRRNNQLVQQPRVPAWSDQRPTPRPYFRASTSRQWLTPRHVLISAIQLHGDHRLTSVLWLPATRYRYTLSTHISVLTISLFGSLP